MTDQTNRYARRTITVTGLAHGEVNDDQPFTLEGHGVRWNLYGKNEPPQHIEAKTVTRMVNGKEIPSGFTVTERLWIKELAQENGLDYAEVTEVTNEVWGSIPYIQAPVLFDEDAPEWWGGKIHFKMARCTNTLTVVIEGDDNASVVHEGINRFVTNRIAQLRGALAACGFTEHDVSIDCEILRGAERTLACDPAMMKAMLNNDDQGEEE